MKLPPEPNLDRPGAGLPIPERWIARLLFAHKLRTGSRERFRAVFHEEREKIAHLVADLPVADRSTRVLIPRLRGLEDSSRYWSVWMTLDHLRITNESFANVVRALGSGRIPPGKADTAAVKPDPAVGAEIEQAYTASCDAFLAAMDAVSELRTSLRFEHPWFGPLDAFGWTALAATHLGIHRSQIERIGKKFRSGSST